MNTTIRLACVDCGSLTITDAEINVVCLDKRWSYNFQCPQCGLRSSTACSKRIADMVIDVGVVPQWLATPLELFEDKLGPPITEDDLIDFHNWLAQDLM